MSNQGSNLLVSIQTIPMLYKRLFGGELDFYDMLELLEVVLRETGGISPKVYLYQGSVVDHKLTLPCEVYGIMHVCDTRPTSWYSQFMIGRSYDHLVNYRVDQSGNIGVYNPDATNIDLITGDTSDVYEINSHIFTAPLGRMIDYHNDNNIDLHFNFETRDVDVLYVNPVFDENGYPKIPQKSAEAVAYYMQYIEMRMRYNMNKATEGQVKLARTEKIQKLAAARTPDFLSQNELDDFLNVLTSSNRKRHNHQHRK